MEESDCGEILAEKETDNVGLSCALESFTEYREVSDLIDKLSHIYADKLEVEIQAERYTLILDQYQEQPHLLDPYLDSMLTKLIGIARDKNNALALTRIAFQYIKHIMKVRGYKTVVRYLPHEVKFLVV